MHGSFLILFQLDNWLICICNAAAIILPGNTSLHFEVKGLHSPLSDLCETFFDYSLTDYPMSTFQNW